MSYKYTKILASDTIGNSLSSVNKNYLTLEQETLNLKLSSDNLWSVMQQYYLEYGPIIKDAINTINIVSPTLFKSTTVVQNNSAGWLKPIVVFYPTIFPSNYSNKTIVNTISAWIQEYFPVIPLPSYVTDPNTGAINIINPTEPSYVETQKLIIYAHTWNINANPSGNTVLTDSTTCHTYDQRICANCRICYYGGTFCNFDTWEDCGGACSDCSVCKDLNCSYAAPPYIPLYSHAGNTYAQGGITATINIQYQDVGELQTINAFEFSVKDCNWVLERSIGQ
jgi:hypothetical protein